MTKAWYEVKVFDDDDEITLECLVDTYAMDDPYGTGDSPTLYETDVVRAVHEGNEYELTRQQEADVIEQVFEQLADNYMGGYDGS